MAPSASHNKQAASKAATTLIQKQTDLFEINNKPLFNKKVGLFPLNQPSCRQIQSCRNAQRWGRLYGGRSQHVAWNVAEFAGYLCVFSDSRWWLCRLPQNVP
jgi:hypothetical protein